jgi:hypothetical protein
MRLENRYLYYDDSRFSDATIEFRSDADDKIDNNIHN